MSGRVLDVLQCPDDEIMQVICSTCQNGFRLLSRRPATAGLLCMGLFSLFWFATRGRATPTTRDHDGTTAFTAPVLL